MQTAINILKQAGLKSTSSRLVVVSVLAQNSSPLTHQDLLKKLPENFDRVTLYRVLDWLLQQQLIHRVAGDDRAWRFQINNVTNNRFKQPLLPNKSPKQILNQHSHAHFQCSACGKIFCLDDIQPKLNHNIPEHFTVDSIELNIKGICPNCQA